MVARSARVQVGCADAPPTVPNLINDADAVRRLLGADTMQRHAVGHIIMVHAQVKVTLFSVGDQQTALAALALRLREREEMHPFGLRAMSAQLRRAPISVTGVPVRTGRRRITTRAQ